MTTQHLDSTEPGRRQGRPRHRRQQRHRRGPRRAPRGGRTPRGGRCPPYRPPAGTGAEHGRGGRPLRRQSPAGTAGRDRPRGHRRLRPRRPRPPRPRRRPRRQRRRHAPVAARLPARARVGPHDRRQRPRPAARHRRSTARLHRAGLRALRHGRQHRRPRGGAHRRRHCATKYAAWAISEGLRQESPPFIRVTTVSPGVVTSELADTITDPGAAEAMRAYRARAIDPDAVARAVSYALAQPSDVDVNEIVVRPTRQR
ncbi:hypothetical protein SGLAM104S_08307 [Streptomyces glaucescens]